MTVAGPSRMAVSLSACRFRMVRRWALAARLGVGCAGTGSCQLFSGVRTLRRWWRSVRVNRRWFALVLVLMTRLGTRRRKCSPCGHALRRARTRGPYWVACARLPPLLAQADWARKRREASRCLRGWPEGGSGRCRTVPRRAAHREGWVEHGSRQGWHPALACSARA